MNRNPIYRLYTDQPAAAWAATLLAVALGIRLVTDFNGLYGQDSYAYTAQAEALQEWMRTGTTPPPFFWPEGYPLTGAALGMLLGLPAALQWTSLLGGAATVYFTIRIGRQLYPQLPWLGPFLFLIVGLSPYGLRSSLLVMSDSWAGAALTAGGWWSLRYAQNGKIGPLIGAGLALGVAVTTRYALALPTLLPLGMILRAAVRKRDLRSLLFPLLFLFLLFLHQSIHTGMGGGLAEHHFLRDWSLANGFQRDFAMADGEFHYPRWNLFEALSAFWHPGLSGLGVLALPLMARKKIRLPDRTAGAMLATTLVYLLFIAGIPFQNPRFLLPVLPLVGLLYAVQLARAVENSPPKIIASLGLGVAVIHLGLGAFALRHNIKLNRTEREIAAAVCTQDPPKVYTFALDGALRTYCPGISLENLWNEGPPTAQDGEWILFNAPAFAEQWRGKSVMRNWEFLNRNFHLQVRQQLPAGWTLYEIAP
ncbi:MAG: hypothetical protein AAGN35_26480 [Bacteroidota bacterium]